MLISCRLPDTEAFDDLQLVRDSKRKGKRLLWTMGNDFKVDAYMAPPGIAVLDCDNYWDLSSIFSMQSTNSQYSSKGSICIGRILKMQGRKRRKRFKDLPPGPVEDIILCIPQVPVKNDDGELCVVIHKLSGKQTRGRTLKEAFAASASMDEFVRASFSSSRMVIPVGDIDLVYSCQIAGPVHRSSKIEQCVYQYESGETTIEMRPTPDKWIDSFISNKTTDMHIITPPNNNSWKPGHRLHRPAKSRRKLPRSKKSMLDALGLPKVQHRTLNNPATILICRPNPTILTQQDIDYDKGDIFEYLQSGDNDTSQSMFVELNNRQTWYINTVFADYSNHLPPDGYDMMLDNFIKESGRSKLHFYNTTVNDNTEETVMISLLLEDEKDPDGEEVTKVSTNVWKKTAPNTKNGVLGIEDGIVVQQIYEWPMEKTINKDHIELIKAAVTGSTKRYVTSHSTNGGKYINVGKHGTSMGSASMGSSPFTKQNHDHWNQANVKAAIYPFVAGFINRLRRQSCQVALTCGQILSPMLKVVEEYDYFEVFLQCVVTMAFSNHRHIDGDKMSVEESIKVFEALRNFDGCSEEHKEAIDSYLTKLQKIDISKTKDSNDNRLPIDTTCAWTLTSTSYTYDLRHYFLNLRAGIALDISSKAFQHAKVVGSTFFGGLFEHATSRPLWIRKSDGYVTITQPKSDPMNFVFAWGDHKEKKALTRGITQARRANDRALEQQLARRLQVLLQNQRRQQAVRQREARLRRLNRSRGRGS